MRIAVFIGCFALFTLLLIPTKAYSAEIIVDTTADSGIGSLRQAIADANPAGGDVIVFDVPLPATINTLSPLNIDKPLTIKGPGLELLTINSTSDSNVVAIIINDSNDAEQDRVVISGITLTRILDGIGTGIINFEDLTLTECRVFGLNNGITNMGANTMRNGGVVDLNGVTIQDGGIGVNNLGSEGGMMIPATVNVNHSLFLNLTLGIFNRGSEGLGTLGAEVIVNNSTFFFNGSGIVNEGALSDEALGGVIDMSFCSVIGNLIGFDSLVTVSGLLPNYTVKNSIIGENMTDCSGETAIFAQGNNFDTDGTCLSIAGSNITTVTADDLNLDPNDLQENGGPTRTIALCEGEDDPAVGCLATPSVAIDAATDCTFIGGNTTVPVDQRYFPRPFNTTCDVGAFEAQPVGTLTITNSTMPTGLMEFEYTGTGFPEGCGLNMFNLNGGDSKSCILPTAQYTVMQDLRPGSVLDGITCNLTPTSVTSDSVTVDLAEGNDFMCTFNNKAIETLTLTIAGDGEGVLLIEPSGETCEPECIQMFPIGTEVTLTPVPEPGSNFVGFTGAGCGQNITLNESIACTAEFSLLPTVALINREPADGGVIYRNQQNRIKLVGLSPNQKTTLLLGYKRGAGQFSTGSCGTIPLGIIPFQTLAKFRANGSGMVNKTFYMPSSSENRAFLQVVDLFACEVGPVIEVKLTN